MGKESVDYCDGKEFNFMNHEFVFTPADVYKIIIAIAGFIITLTAAIKIIMEIINKAKEPDRLQDERIQSLEGRVSSLERAVTMYGQNSKKAEEAWIIYMEAMLDLMDHTIYGNHVEKLKQTRDKMQHFLAQYGLEKETYQNSEEWR